MIYNMKYFGEQFTEIRKSRGFSIKKLSQTSGVAINTIRAIERASTVPSLVTLDILSSTLKYELKDLMVKNNSDHRKQLNELRYELDLITETRNYQDLIPLKKKLVQYYQLVRYEDDLIGIQVKQMILWVHGLIRGKIEENQVGAIQSYIVALRLTIKKFDIHDFYDIKFSYDELDMLNSIASCYLRLDKIDEGIEILQFIFHYSNEHFTKMYMNPQLFLKACYNLSSAYFEVKAYNKSIIYAVTGIEFNKKNRTFVDLWALYFRKALAEYILGIENYSKTLDKSRSIYLIMNTENMNYVDELFEAYKTVK